MANNINFLSLKLAGVRFDSHTIPFDVLKDISVIEKIVIENAKTQYLKQNPTRKRVPRDFISGVTINLKSISEGSTCLEFDLEQKTEKNASLFSQNPYNNLPYYEESRDEVIDTIQEISNNKYNGGRLDEKCFKHIGELGQSLQDGESLSVSGNQKSVVINKKVRKQIAEFVTDNDFYTQSVTLTGTVPEIDKQKSTFSLLLEDGKRISCPVDLETASSLYSAFNEYENNQHVTIKGLAQKNQQEHIIKMVKIEQIDLFEASEVVMQIDELKKLEEGWLDGYGNAYCHNELQWLEKIFLEVESQDLPKSYFYPLEDGGVSIEWDYEDWDITLEINLQDHAASWHAFNKTTDKIVEFELDMDGDSFVRDLVRKFQGLKKEIEQA